jgi:hypothetical protein
MRRNWLGPSADLFGGKDLVGEFFTKDTVFKSGYTDLGLLYVDFEHGMDPDRIGNDDSCVIGTIDWKSAKADDTGIYVERILSRRAGYMEFIEELIDAGYMGSSSAAIPGKTTKKSSGEIVEWPLMRDSLTVTPHGAAHAGRERVVSGEIAACSVPSSEITCAPVRCGNPRASAAQNH